MTTDLAALRLRYLAAIGFGGLGALSASCTRGRTGEAAWVDTTPNGFMAAPADAPMDGGAPPRVDAPDAAAPHAATRVLPPEPVPPPRTVNCSRETLCREQEDEAPPIAFPAPFERCSDVYGKSTQPAQFSVAATRSARQTDPQACCYVEYRNCAIQMTPMRGRPLRDADGAIVTAPPRPRRDWSAEPRAFDVGRVHAETRRREANRWRDDAALEHASVAAFARFALELMALGAPADLVAAAHEAALDEIAHARTAYAIAAAYDGVTTGPAPLGALAMRRASLIDLARETFLDGCLGETHAAVDARERAFDPATPPAIRAALLAMADDEERHAELAWRAVAWAVREGGGPVAAALRDALATVATAGEGARARIVRDVVAPCAEALLGYLA